ncbi:WG repeat-containing protein [Cytophaga aurantiaca]|uniref:WG repeat-containing protein n=1 Tax=Cytophaga aurantiaca TaxID=29530 RepID=UPI00037ECA82|nr:WG repeat-containing protein [Cytophaga aurantiaca]
MMLRFIFIFLFLTIFFIGHAQTQQYHEGLTPYSENINGKSQFGFKDKSGKVIISARFDGIAEPFSSGQAVVILNNLQGTIDLKGKMLISAIYKKILPSQFNLTPVQNTAGLWGFYASDIKLTVPCLYDNFKFTNKGKHIFVQKNGKWGMIDHANTQLAPFDFKQIESIASKQIKGTRYNSWKLHTSDGSVKKQYEYDSVSFTKSALLNYSMNGWEGLITTDGIIVLKNTYEDIDDIIGDAFAVKKDGSWGVKKLNSDAWLIDPSYDVIDIDSTCIHAGLRIGNGKAMHWKLYDFNGLLLYPTLLTDYHAYSNGLIAVKSTSDLWGFINTKGETVIPFTYNWVDDFENGLCRVEKTGQQLVINKSGDVVFNHQDVYLFSIGLLKLNAHQDKTYTYNIDSKTEIIPINAEFVKIKKGDKYGLINTRGETVLQTIYSDIQIGNSLKTFSVVKDKIIKVIQVNKATYSVDKKILSTEGFYNEFAVMKYANGRFGCIDNLGKIRIAPQYEVIRPFENEVAVVQLNGKWGIIDKNESFVAQPYYDSISTFRNKICIVSEKGVHYLMDCNGKILTPDGYSSITLTKGGNYLLVKNKLKGIANANGKEIISPRYQNIKEFSPTLFRVTENNLQGVIDSSQKIILHIKYHAILYNASTQEFLTAEEGEANYINVK